MLHYFAAEASKKKHRMYSHLQRYWKGKADSFVFAGFMVKIWSQKCQEDNITKENWIVQLHLDSMPLLRFLIIGSYNLLEQVKETLQLCTYIY